MALVDVVIPAFDPGRYLRLAIDSVVAQTCEDWRAVVVDDGSTEDLGWVQSVDPRVMLVRQSNRGLSAARNRGVILGTAPFVAFLDDDDAWLPHKLEHQITAMGSSVGMSSTAMELIDGDGWRIGGGFEGHAESWAELLQGNGICASTVVVRRDVLARTGLFDLDLAQVQDWDLWLRIAREAKIVKLAEILAQYRVHKDSMSRNYLRFRTESNLVLYRNSHGGGKRFSRRGRRRVAELAGAQALDEFRANRRPRHLFWAVRLNPAYSLYTIGSELVRSGWPRAATPS